MLLRLFIVFFLSTGCVFADKAEINAQQWLEKMTLAMKVLNYQGTIVFFKQGRLDTMKYFHATDKGQEQERLLALNSPMREVIREAGKVRCVFKESKKAVVNHCPVNNSFIVNLPTDFSSLENIYHFSLEGKQSVAMRPTRIISIKAKDNYRYSRKIWIDQDYFLPLKIEVYSSSGVILEHVVFTELKISETLAFIDIEQKMKNIDIKHIHQDALLSIDKADFSLRNIPSGFQNIFFTHMHMDNSDQVVGHLLLSDGFSSVSVYREVKADDIQSGLQMLGAVNTFTRVVNGFQITAMGEVPAKTVQFIAQGVTFNQ